MSNSNNYSHYIYCDECNDNLKNIIESELNINIIVRDNENWDINYLSKIITTPMMVLCVINNINEQSVCEIALSSFMCKSILVTNKTIIEYPKLELLVNHIDYSANLLSENSTFVSWYNYFIK